MKTMKLEKAIELVLKGARVHAETYEAFLDDQKDEIVEATKVVEDFFVNNVFVPEDEICD